MLVTEQDFKEIIIFCKTGTKSYRFIEFSEVQCDVYMLGIHILSRLVEKVLKFNKYFIILNGRIETVKVPFEF